MLVLTVIAVAAAVVAALIGLRSLRSGTDPLDVGHQEQWLVTHAPARLTRPLAFIDRRVLGGVAVGASFLVLFAVALVVGWIFSGVDDGTGIARFDESAAEWGRDHATETSTRVLGALTDLGGTIPLVVVLASIGVYHAVRRHDSGPAIYVAAVGIGVTALNNGLKFVIDRDRPDIAQLTGHAGSSFPSGHSAAAAACWAAIALVATRRSAGAPRIGAGIVAVVIAVVVAATRVLLGVHWLSDVVAGVLVGWAWFLVVTIAVGGRSLRLGRPAEHASRRPLVGAGPSRPDATISTRDEPTPRRTTPSTRTPSDPTPRHSAPRRPAPSDSAPSRRGTISIDSRIDRSTRSPSAVFQVAPRPADTPPISGANPLRSREESSR